MYRWPPIVGLFLQTLLLASPQARPPDAEPEPVVLKSAAHVVELDVFASDPSGEPAHGLHKSDFIVTDNGHSRDIRIFSGEIDLNQTSPSSTAIVPPPGVYSNRLGMRDARIVTAVVIDAMARPEGLQKDAGALADRPGLWFGFVRSQAEHAIRRMEPGQAMAIYATCPELRVVQDYTSDPDRLIASLRAFVPPLFSKARGKKQVQKIDALVPPMLSALREVAARMSGASGRKNLVWVSQAYGTDLDPSAISEATDETVNALNGANIPLYAVDARFSPTCLSPANFSTGNPEAVRSEQEEIITLTCSQLQDASDDWMRYLAGATGGRAFTAGKIFGVQKRNPLAHVGGIDWSYEYQLSGGIVSDALRFAVDDSRYAYVMGFYVPESEMDGMVHTLSVMLPTKPKFGLRYRSGYIASADAAAPPATPDRAKPDSRPKAAGRLDPPEVGIDAKIDRTNRNELGISLSLVPDTITRSKGMVMLEATFAQTDDSGKQLANVQETVQIPSPETQTEMVRYSRSVKLINGAVLLHISIRDQVTNRVGSIAIPIGKQ